MAATNEWHRGEAKVVVGETKKKKRKGAKASEDMKLSIMKEKFLAMVESKKARVKDYTKLVVTDGMVDYNDKGKRKLVEDNGKGKEVEHHHLKVNKDDKGKGKLVDDNGKGKVKQVDDHDVDTLDLENRIKKLEEDFGWLLKAKKAKESKKAKKAREAQKAREAELAKQAKKEMEAELKAKKAKKAKEEELKAKKAKEAMLAELKAK
ncbi:hypothetical protein Tco_0604306 [Tanacetum coccineum]